MPQVVDDLIFNVRGNLTTLDSDLRTAETKLKAAKDRIEKSGIMLKLKVDTSTVEKDIEAFVRRISTKLNIKGKVTLDMSSVETQLTAFESRLGRLSGSVSMNGGGFAGNFIGGVAGARLAGGMPNMMTNTVAPTVLSAMPPAIAAGNAMAFPNSQGVTVSGKSCPKCGSANANAAIFCKVCGGDLRGGFLGRAKWAIDNNRPIQAAIQAERIGRAVIGGTFKAVTGMATAAAHATNRYFNPTPPPTTLEHVNNAIWSQTALLSQIRDIIPHTVEDNRKPSGGGGGGGYRMGGQIRAGGGKVVIRGTSDFGEEKMIRSGHYDTGGGGFEVQSNAAIMAAQMLMGVGVPPIRRTLLNKMSRAQETLSGGYRRSGNNIFNSEDKLVASFNYRQRIIPYGGGADMDSSFGPMSLSAAQNSNALINGEEMNILNGGKASSSWRFRQGQAAMAAHSRGSFSGGPIGPMLRDGSFSKSFANRALFGGGAMGGGNGGIGGIRGLMTSPLMPFGAGMATRMGGMSLGGIGAGLAVGGAAIYAGASIYGEMGQREAGAIRSASSIRSGTNYSASDQYQSALVAGGRIPQLADSLALGIGGRIADGMNSASLARSQVTNERVARISGFMQDQDLRVLSQGTDDPRTKARLALESGVRDIDRNAGIAAQGTDGGLRSKIFQAATRDKKALRAQFARQDARTEATADALSAANVRISGLSGVDDREAQRENIRASYAGRINSGDAGDRSRAARELYAALGAEDRNYKFGTSMMTGGANINALMAGGFKKEASLAQNALNESVALRGVTDPDRIAAIKSDRRSADKMTMKEYENALQDLISSTKSAAMALGGNGLAATLEEINNKEKIALSTEGDPATRAAIAANAAGQRQGAQMGAGLERLGVNMGTAGLNRSATSNRMRNRGQFISADVNDIIGGTNDAIAQANIDLRGSEKTKDREARIAAIKNEANSRLEGISEMTRYTGRLGITSSQNFFGDSNNRAFADLANAQSAIAGANAGFNATGAATDVTKNSQGGTEQQQNQKMIDLLQKIADKYGTTAG